MQYRFAQSVVLLALVGCSAAQEAESGPSTTPASVDAGAPDGEPRDALPLASLVSTACAPTLEAQEAKYRAHVARDTVIAYESNPPSWGLHYPTWVEYGAHRLPVDRREYVHNAEHGSIVLLYKCESADACPSIASALERVAASVPAEAFCETWPGGGVRARVVVTPDPLLDVPVAAMAWGHTYRASCFDAASLLAFAEEHIGQGPELNCADGAGGSSMSPTPAPPAP
jgi:hypothetical protein